MHDPNDTKIKELYQQVNEQMHEKLSIWLDSILFTWQWWIGAVLSILPWILWMIFRRKESTLRLLTVGFFIMFFATLSDSLGVQLGFWYYKHAVLPLIPAFLPWDTTLIPVIIMALIQYKPKMNPYLKGLLFAVVASYLAEPFFIWIELYKPIVWKHMYSLPIYFFLFVISHKMYYGKSFEKGE